MINPNPFRKPVFDHLDMYSFREFVQATPFALLRLRNKPPAEPSAQLRSYVEAEHRGSVTIGSMSRRRSIPAAWWQKHFRQVSPEEGFHLFHRGSWIAHTQGRARLDEKQAGIDLALAGLALAARSRPLMAQYVAAAEARDLNATIAWLEGVIARTKAKPGPAAGKHTSAPPAPAPPPKVDPHELLGVSPTATFEEKRAAYKEAIAKNHPDKVAHMDKEIQKVAEERTKRFNVAWAEIEKGQK